MRRLALRMGGLSVAGVLLGMALVGSLRSAGVVLCIGNSMPKGVYLKVHGHRDRLNAGDVVLACPLDSSLASLALARSYLSPGPCAAQSAMLIKRVAAVGGDRVQITLLGVSINSVGWPSSAPLATDPSGRPMPIVFPLTRTLDPEEVLLMSDNAPLAFDGRYFGLTARRDVLHVLRPVLTWEVQR